MSGLLKHIWGGNLVGLGPQSHAARIGFLFPVRSLDVVRIGQEILAFSPRNRIINVKGNGHIVFPGNGKRIVDELASFLVGHVETEGPHGETQLVPGISRRSDSVDHVVNKLLQLHLLSAKWPGIG